MVKSTIFKRKKGATAIKLSGKTYILVGDRNKLLELNETGSVIWKSLRLGSTLENLNQSLLRHFSVSSGKLDILLRDTRKFLTVLSKFGLLEVRRR